MTELPAIVERLRREGVEFHEQLEAAAEIERLQDTIRFANKVMDAKDADNARLRAALEETVVAIVHVQKHLINGSPPQDAVMNGALAIARRALEPKP